MFYSTKTLINSFFFIITGDCRWKKSLNIFLTLLAPILEEGLKMLLAIIRHPTWFSFLFEKDFIFLLQNNYKIMNNCLQKSNENKNYCNNKN